MGKYQECHNLIIALLQHFAEWTKKHYNHDSTANVLAHNCTRNIGEYKLSGNYYAEYWGGGNIYQSVNYINTIDNITLRVK
jgi:hypothetical protein